MKYTYNKIILLFITGSFLSAGTPLSAKTVVDQLGREVSLPDDPQRVVSLAPSITEIIFALGREHRLKGVTRFSDFPPEAAKLPKVGSYVRLDLEKIVALRPDLCFAIKDGNPREIAERLESLGIPVYAVDPKNLESVMETFLDIGRVLNANKEAKDIVGKMRSRITRVKSLVANASHRPKVFFQIGLSPIVAGLASAQGLFPDRAFPDCGRGDPDIHTRAYSSCRRGKPFRRSGAIPTIQPGTGAGPFPGGAHYYFHGKGSKL